MKNLINLKTIAGITSSFYC